LSKDRERARERERSGETETGVKAEVGEGKQGRLEKVAWTVGGGISAAFFSSLEKYSCVALSVTDSEDDEEGEGTTTTPRPGFSGVTMGQAEASSTSRDANASSGITLTRIYSEFSDSITSSSGMRRRGSSRDCFADLKFCICFKNSAQYGPCFAARNETLTGWLGGD
jgi:hypothetical protein